MTTIAITTAELDELLIHAGRLTATPPVERTPFVALYNRLTAEGASRAKTLAEATPELGALLLRDPGPPASLAAVDANPLRTLTQSVVEAVVAYDASGDHRHEGGPRPGDCVRCRIVEALPPAAAAVVGASTDERALRAYVAHRGSR